MLSSVVTSKTTWVFLGNTRRHSVTFIHNTFTGSRRLYVDEKEVFASGWRYALTGSLCFALDGKNIEVYVRTADDTVGSLEYLLSVDAKEIEHVDASLPSGASGAGALASPGRASGAGAKDPRSPGGGGGVSTWVFLLPSGIHQVEFVWSTLEVIVDGRKVDAEGDFDDSGPGTIYSFQMLSGIKAVITATPATAEEKRAGAHAMKTKLVVESVGEIPQSELLGQGDGNGTGGVGEVAAFSAAGGSGSATGMGATLP
jgi:hypothetical protein